MARQVHLVVDTGVDDALAIVVAWLHPDLDLTGVTAAAGNVSLAQSLTNTRFVLEAIGAGRVPVSGGAGVRVDGAPFERRYVHGPDGLAGLVGETPRSTTLAAATPPMLAVADATTLVCLAPMTSLLPLSPREVVATYARPGEPNHAMDPAAANQVRSCWRVHDVTPQASLSAWPGAGAGARTTDVSWLVDSLVGHQRRRGAGLGDAEALLILAGSRDPVTELVGLLAG